MKKMHTKQGNKFKPEIKNLFLAAINGNTEEIIRLVNAGLKINQQYAGRRIIHVLSEHGHAATIQYLINTSDIDLNVADFSGNYPLSLACRAGKINATKVLMEAGTLIYFSFDERHFSNYHISQDPIRMAIRGDNSDLLFTILKVMYCQRRLPYFNHKFLNRLLHSSISYNSKLVTQKLSSYLREFSEFKKIFETKADVELMDITTNNQSISRVETSFVASIKRLCARYNIDVINDLTADPTKPRKILQTNIDLNAYFVSLANIIEHTKVNDYKVYKEYSGVHEFDYFVNEDTYKAFAFHIYNQIAGTQISNSDISGWRSFWCEDGTEIMKPGVGLSLKDIWSLAVYAAQDRISVDGEDITDHEIITRGEILVRALVDACRAYNCNNDGMYDTGGASQQSCTHGIAVRALLFLSNIHPDINIESNTTEWATDIAREELTKIFLAHKDKQYLSSILQKFWFQVSSAEKLEIKRFYEQSKPILARALESRIGLLKNGGYLLESDFEKILKCIEDYELPILSTLSKDYNSQLKLTPDYQSVSNSEVISHKGIKLHQYKLPQSTDSFFAAIIISHWDFAERVDEQVDVKQLRAKIADLLDAAMFNASELEKYFSKHAIPNSRVIAPLPVMARIIQKNFENYYPLMSISDKKEYIDGIRTRSTADQFILTLISIIFASNIRIFDLNGTFILDLNCRSQFVTPHDNDKYLHLICNIYYSSTKKNIDFNSTNALVRPESWAKIYPKLSKLKISSLTEQIRNDAEHYIDFQTMPGRGVAEFDQIKIPGDGDCCFNAVLTAARHSNVAQAYSIGSVSEFRLLVQSELKILYETTASNSEQNFNEVLDNFLIAIQEYNEQYIPTISTPEEYIEAIGRDGCWGGHLELQMMAKILQLKINVYSLDRTSADIVGDLSATTEINIFHAINHYNVLVRPNTWNRANNYNHSSSANNKRARLAS